MAYGEELKILASGQELEDSFLPDRLVGISHCSFSEPFPPTELQSLQDGATSEAPSNWLTLCPTPVIP